MTMTHDTLSASEREKADELLDELLDLPASDRFAMLNRRCARDTLIFKEVASLLRALEASRDFLATPVSPAALGEVPDLCAGTQIGIWRIVRRVGRGGMGDVFEAARTQGDFEQRVAIKLLQHEAAEQLERFRFERQILARLEHPGIARLHDGGIAPDGRPFMVMEFVTGQPITEFCARTRATLTRRTELFLQVCDAVAYAHRNLIVHRDLKPSNILVSTDGQVKLLDFGVAKLIDGVYAQQTRAAPLTPTCAAPEQLNGGAITTATDVYALGLLLFELLTGSHPWTTSGTPVLQALRALSDRSAPRITAVAEARNDPPVEPRALRGDLDAIVAKALRSEPAHRYATVDALKADVERWMRGAPVAAREGARLYVMGRVLRRYRWVALAALIVLLSLAGGLGVAAWQARRAALERDIARRDAAREEAVRYDLTRMFRAAIADHGSEPATAKSIVDSSAQRVLREYGDQPQLLGPLVLALADLYGALEDVPGAGALLEGFVEQPASAAEPAILADARQKLANIELLRGRRDRANVLLNQAESFWAQAPQKYPDERLEGLGIRAKLQRADGDLNGAIATSRAAIAQRVALSGHDHRETANLYNSLAITLMAANRLAEALDAYRETSAIYRAIGLGDSLDAQVILGNTGTLEMRIGDLREAETLLKTAIARERELAGDSAAVSAAMGYYGRILTITNRTGPAIAELTQAVEVATRYAGAESPVSLQNRLFLGEAQLSSQDIAGARATINAMYEGAQQHYGSTYPLTLRARLARAQLSAAVGRSAEARIELSPVIDAFRKAGAAAATDLAQALISLGELELAARNIPAALSATREALRSLEAAHIHGWEPLEAQERLGEILAAGDDIPEATRQLRQAAYGLEVELGAQHPQTLRAKAAFSRIKNPQSVQSN